ncbi:hypothetical protein [Priestia aryabhattai]
MKDYVRIENVSLNYVDAYLKKGWEVIETLRYSETYGSDNRVEYHIGLPARVWANDLLAVIQQYEEKGFKEKLFEAVAEEHGQKVSDYNQFGYRSSGDETAVFMEKYETAVQNKEVIISKESSNYSL